MGVILGLQHTRTNNDRDGGHLPVASNGDLSALETPAIIKDLELEH